MSESTVTMETADGPMDGFLALPEGKGPFSAVVVAQDAFGVGDYLKEVCRRLAREGFVALAPELFHRTGRGVIGSHADFTAMRPHFTALTNEGIAMDIGAALERLTHRPEVDASRLSIVGFCVGGFVAYLAATRFPLDAAVVFYGGGITDARPGVGITPVLGDTKKISARVLGLFGDADASIPAEQVAAIKHALTEAGVRHEVKSYAGAGHGFFCDVRPSFEPKAAADAWQRTLAWLRA